MKAHFAGFARYNAWANRRLYEAAAGLSDAQLRADEGAFFGSLHATLNHLLVTDVIWMARIRGLQGPPWRLDHIAHEDFADLRAAREALDADIIEGVDALRESDISAGEIAYTDSQVGRLLQELRQRELLDNTLVVLAADHGESLGGHGEAQHGFFVYEEAMHVPLIIRVPFGDYGGQRRSECSVQIR